MSESTHPIMIIADLDQLQLFPWNLERRVPPHGDIPWHFEGSVSHPGKEGIEEGRTRSKQRLSGSDFLLRTSCSISPDPMYPIYWLSGSNLLAFRHPIYCPPSAVKPRPPSYSQKQERQSVRFQKPAVIGPVFSSSPPPNHVPKRC
jgi:hypothetical protein